VRKQSDRKQKPRFMSPTPLRDWVNRQSRLRRAAMVVLFAMLMACGGKAAVRLPLTPVPATQQLLFVLLAGALLGSRLGAVSAAFYLLASAATGLFWPEGAGATPLSGPLAGYLWSLPLTAYLCGFFVERARSERPVYFAIGASAGIAVFGAFGTARLLWAMGLDATEAFIKGMGLFVGQHAAHGALTVLIASSASTTLQTRENK
jgi:biotin transport system substrate-specific component